LAARFRPAAESCCFPAPQSRGQWFPAVDLPIFRTFTVQEKEAIRTAFPGKKKMGHPLPPDWLSEDLECPKLHTLYPW